MPPRLLAALLALYPRTLRDAYGPELTRSLERAWAEARAAHPLACLLIVVVRTLWDAGQARAAGGLNLRLWTDLRHAGRVLRSSPGFFAGLLATLAIGVGANAAVFSLVKAVVLQPLPYAREDELVMLWRSPVEIQPGAFWRSASTPRFLLGWRAQASDVVEVAGSMDERSLAAQMDVQMPGGTERLRGAFATPNFFDVLGARAQVGRTFTAADESASAPMAVLSHSLWRRAFDADPQVVGRSVTLVSGRGARRQPATFVVIGVLEPAFRFHYPNDVEVWAPMSWADVARENPDSILYHVVGRLRPGVTRESAAARLAALHDVIRPTPGVPQNRRQTTTIEPIHDWVVGDARPTMRLLAGVALLLLVLTCATTANALFVRISERRRELALRMALGAGASRLLRQLLSEGFALAALGTALGVALAAALMPALRRLVPLSVPRGDEIAVDVWVLGFAAASVTAVTVLAAVAPALRGVRLSGRHASAGSGLLTGGILRQSASTLSADRSTARWRQALVAVQAALASALLVAATLLLISFRNVATTPLGFDAGNLLTVETREIGSGSRDPERLRARQARMVARIAEVPGVRAVGLASAVPFRGVDWYRNFDIAPGRSVSANERQVDSTYFTLLRIPLRAGRLISTDDRAGTAPVAVVSESFARAAFGDANPLGRTIGVGDRSVPTTVVGLVSDVRYASYVFDPQRAVYLPIAQQPSELVCLLVDPAPGVSGLERAIRDAIRDVDPMLPAMKFAALSAILDDSLADRRFYTTATSIFGGIALALTIAGLIVIVMRTIVERRKELAIRTALGARASALRSRVVWLGLRAVVGGVVVGLGAAMASAAVLAPFVFGVSVRQAPVYTLVGATLVGAAALGGWLAARRATALPPAGVLRAD